MFRLKMINKPKLFKLKFNFIFPQIVLANMQEKEITPTKETQIVEPDKNYDGLKKVTVNKIPDEYIIPSGEIDITQNGTYNVVDKATANVNIPEKQLGTKTITKNGIYKAVDDNLDGYSEVDVETSGVDINDYFVSKPSRNTKINAFIKAIHLIDISYYTTMNQTFEDCVELTTIPFMDTSNVNSMQYTFRGCSKLTTIPLLNTEKVINMQYMFANCSSLTTLPPINTSNVISMNNTFTSCDSLTTIPPLNTEKTTNMYFMFYHCSSLKTIPLLNANKADYISYAFNYCTNLIDFGGLENLGQAYKTSRNANDLDYQLNLSYSTQLTHESLMNVINNLYDIKTKGCKAQQLILGSTNISKLSAEELQICTERGWSVS